MTNTLFDYEQTTERPGLKLLDLKLRNFKGIRKFDLKADGNNLDIHGDNATGKSTLFDAYSCYALKAAEERYSTTLRLYKLRRGRERYEDMDRFRQD